MSKKELTDEVLKIIKDSSAFVKRQAPALAQEVIGEGILLATVGLSIAAVFLLVAIVCFVIATGLPLNYFNHVSDLAFILYMIGGFSGLISAVVGPINGYNLIFMTKFPKLFLYRNLR